MKLIRFGKPGEEKPGIISSSKRLDVSAFGEDYNERFFETDGLNRLKQWLSKNESSCPVVSDRERLGPCVARPSKLICIGLNYAKHAKEGGLELPKEPIIFFKSTTAIVGPDDDLIIPKNSVKTDWEAELAIVIGKRALYVDEANALNYVAGYALHNDYSEREFQMERSGQWVKGKSADTFAPLGPWLATKDEITNPQQLKIWSKVNGKPMQNSSTDDMIFDVTYLVSYISQFMTLLPGDVISTGTPEGVGWGFRPPVYLKPGDVIELGIDGLGSSRQVARAYSK